MELHHETENDSLRSHPMHTPLASPIPSKTDALKIKFEGGIPTSQAAAALKFGLEDIPGIESVHFAEDDAIEVVVDCGRVGMELLWKCIVRAGFATESVTLCGETHTDRPAEIAVELGETPCGTAAA